MTVPSRLDSATLRSRAGLAAVEALRGVSGFFGLPGFCGDGAADMADSLER
ncbi:hypothetical protein GCM10010377_71730 [Streptomyces viridiviolaceus]|nr:hypothetical protein GCM10010377_71730 [Streptomyces viridiviolaceus]